MSHRHENLKTSGCSRECRDKKKQENNKDEDEEEDEEKEPVQCVHCDADISDEEDQYQCGNISLHTIHICHMRLHVPSHSSAALIVHMA
jgi:hypothetical protein